MIFNIHSWADVRAALYTLLPIVSTLLVGYGVFTADKAQLWAALVTAVLGPVIAAVQARTVSMIRTAFYGVLGAGQAIAVGYGLATDAQFSTWLPLVVALVGSAAGGVAVANTDTTPSAGAALKAE
jgi:CHASE2 domain-containing sensor protein